MWTLSAKNKNDKYLTRPYKAIEKYNVTLHISLLLMPVLLKDRLRVTRVTMTAIYIPHASRLATLVTLAFLCRARRSAVIEISNEACNGCVSLLLAKLTHAIRQDNATTLYPADIPIVSSIMILLKTALFCRRVVVAEAIKTEKSVKRWREDEGLKHDDVHKSHCERWTWQPIDTRTLT